MEREQFTLDGLLSDNLHCEIWKPPQQPEFAMVLVHGLGEHCNRYLGDFSTFFPSAGAVIYTFDLPGHGQSGGERGHLREHQDLNRILDNRLAQIQADFPNLPIFIYGHSLGGLIAAAYTLEKQPDLNGLLLSAPAFDVDNPVSPVKILMAKIMNKVYPSLILDNGLNREMLSRDPHVVEDYNNDPLVHGVASARLGAFIFSKGDFILNNPQLLNCPTLIMVGSDEAIVSKHAINTFCDASKNCALKTWDGMYHEIHNEKGKNKVFQFSLDWIKERLK